MAKLPATASHAARRPTTPRPRLPRAVTSSLRPSLAACLLLSLSGHASRAANADTPELVVYAAASLRDVLETLGPGFETRHPGVRVRLSFAGSQELRTQIEHGAKADVFMSADERQMARLHALGFVGMPVVFTRNRPVVIVPTTNPAKLSTFSDLPKAARLVVGAPEVPIGAYTDAVLARAEAVAGKGFRDQVVAHVRSRELDVRQVLAKVALGEADAGIVYQSDARLAKDRVIAIVIPENIHVVASYPIAALTTTAHPKLAEAWVAFVLGVPAQAILTAAGFLPIGGAPPKAKDHE